MPPFLRNVISDLVEKRLWPVAVALVAALVAVPILLGGKSDATTPPVDTAAATSTATPAPTTAAQVVSLEQQAAGKTANASSVRDPFVQHHQAHATDAEIRTQVKATATALVAKLGPKKTEGSSSSSSSSSSSASNGGSSSSGDSSTSTGGSTSTGTTTPSTGTTRTPAKRVTTYSVDLSFGESGAERKYDDIARLTPLPSSDSPFFVYMGLSDDRKSATFLINGDVVPSGDGHCTPSPADCQQITLTKGDIEFFDMQSGTAGVVQYQLELRDIKATTTTAAKATTANARESKAGRDVIREIVADDPDKLSSLTYNKGLGLLQHAAVEPSGQAVTKTTTVASGSGS